MSLPAQIAYLETELDRALGLGRRMASLGLITQAMHDSEVRCLQGSIDSLRELERIEQAVRDAENGRPNAAQLAHRAPAPPAGIGGEQRRSA